MQSIITWAFSASLILFLRMTILGTTCSAWASSAEPSVLPIEELLVHVGEIRLLGVPLRKLLQRAIHLGVNGLYKKRS